MTTRSSAQIIQTYAQRLSDAGVEGAVNEVELILCHVLATDRLHLYLTDLNDLTDDQRVEVERLVERRLTREPLQFILGYAEFFGRQFEITPAVMAPTPETERLCDAAIEFAQSHLRSDVSILDVGTGSGVIAVTMASELPEAKVVALDISTEAIEIAQRNAGRHKVSDRIAFRPSDLFEAVVPNESFGLILSNPPYIAEPDYPGLPPEVRADPKIAMTAGEDGLDIIRQLVSKAPGVLTKGGRIMFEIGYDQAEAVAELTGADNRYSSLTIIKDYNDIDRVVILGCGD